MARSKSSIGCLFWIALILLVLVIFLFNRNTINTVIEKTGLLTYLTPTKNTTTPENQTPAPEGTRIPPVVIRQQAEETSAPEKSDSTDEQIVIENHQSDSGTPQPVESTTPEEKQRTRKSVLYFVQIDDESNLTLTSVNRSVHYVDSPLTETLHALIDGLTSSEIGRGLLSFLPEGTALRGVVVRENTAYINFNEAFRFNKFGKEGYIYQLEQIVFTATEFQTVHNVQILIEGEKVSNLGAESPFTGDPLARTSFP